MSHATHLYFDHPAEPDPEEWGLNWATRFTDTKKVFSFMPDNLYANIDTLLSGEKTSVPEVCGRNMEKCDKLQERQNVIGKLDNSTPAVMFSWANLLINT